MAYQGLYRVISGGQTGADQAGLIAAYRSGLQTGGTAPSNFYTEIGSNPILECLGLVSFGDYRRRTIKNVQDSDGTVLLTMTPNSPGSRLTRNEALSQEKPFIEFDTSIAVHARRLVMNHGEPSAPLRDIYDEMCKPLYGWLIDNNVGVLNVAGNREKTKAMDTTYTVTAILVQTFEMLHAADLLIRKL